MNSVDFLKVLHVARHAHDWMENKSIEEENVNGSESMAANVDTLKHSNSHDWDGCDTNHGLSNVLKSSVNRDYFSFWRTTHTLSKYS